MPISLKVLIAVPQITQGVVAIMSFMILLAVRKLNRIVFINIVSGLLFFLAGLVLISSSFNINLPLNPAIIILYAITFIGGMVLWLVIYGLSEIEDGELVEYRHPEINQLFFLLAIGSTIIFDLICSLILILSIRHTLGISSGHASEIVKLVLRNSEIRLFVGLALGITFVILNVILNVMLNRKDGPPADGIISFSVWLIAVKWGK
ncbi:hypothetical protein G9A89_019563 [Geosiphon pyriformis]|nr:hypothetical protein G9A89_019563 [Geosiphon pyriformis]